MAMIVYIVSEYLKQKEKSLNPFKDVRASEDLPMTIKKIWDDYYANLAKYNQQQINVVNDKFEKKIKGAKAVQGITMIATVTAGVIAAVVAPPVGAVILASAGIAKAGGTVASSKMAQDAQIKAANELERLKNV